MKSMMNLRKNRNICQECDSVLYRMDEVIKERLYGYTDGEKNITYDIGRINYVSKTSQERNETDWNNNSKMPEVWDNTEDYNFTKR